MEYQSTIEAPTSLTGKGLHTGKEVHITFKPADEDFGIRFYRTDLPDKPEIRALVDYVDDTSRGTSLKANGAEIKTLEHLMAACAGLAIDNLLIEIDAEELPILDGSSRLYVEAFLKVGIKQQQKEREYFVIDGKYELLMARSGAEFKAYPADKTSYKVNVDYGTQVLASQTAILKNTADFYPEIYNCRTFVFLHELEFLMTNNLVKGGDLDNAIVFVDTIPDETTLNKLSVFFKKSDIQVLENGTLNNLQLRHANEPARHKLLDLMGDLYLLGKPVKGRIVANKPGHAANVEFVKMLKGGTQNAALIINH
ncbi:MAG: UDP-3-O-acyl-N-acetylglucosamine deacetylase [Bacteroidales bacterium]|jgi:UDP-3-O-[3-hydroxymyristoyl] N-acetylglucosamine deacetylase/3-hydroxyacyl-[acyl-carrier-protein] dehydratase|nr:UDP-3-O-acyl-N-acetylglucosamine deacetylase [Bacteroidales bacterium]